MAPPKTSVAPVRRAPDRFAEAVWAVAALMVLLELFALFWLDIF